MKLASISLCLALLAATAQAQIGGQGGMQQQPGTAPSSTGRPSNMPGANGGGIMSTTEKPSNMPGANGGGVMSCKRNGATCSSSTDCCSGMQCTDGKCGTGGGSGGLPPMTPPGGDASNSTGGGLGATGPGGSSGRFICNEENICVAFSESIHIGQASFAFAYAKCIDVCVPGRPHPHGRCKKDGNDCRNDGDCCSGKCQNRLGGNGKMCGAAPSPGPGPQCKPDGNNCRSDSDCCSGKCQNRLGGNGKMCGAAPSPGPTPSCFPKQPLADCTAGTFNPCCSEALECSAKNTPQHPNDERDNIHRCQPIDCAQDSDCPSGLTCKFGEWRGQGTGSYTACAK